MIKYVLENIIDIISSVIVPGEIEQVMSPGINVVSSSLLKQLVAPHS